MSPTVSISSSCVRRSRTRGSTPIDVDDGGRGARRRAPSSPRRDLPDASDLGDPADSRGARAACRSRPGSCATPGERVAAVVAESLAAAVDAAERDRRRVRAAPGAWPTSTPAIAPDAPVLFPEHGSNVALDWSSDGVAGVPRSPVPSPGFRRSDVVTRTELRIPRLCGRADGRSRGPRRARRRRPRRLDVDPGTPSGPCQLAALAAAPGRNGSASSRPHVGGGFGGKAHGGVADHVVTAAAGAPTRPAVQFVEDRASEPRRDAGSRRGAPRRVARGARDGRVVGLRAGELCDTGAYPARARSSRARRG